MMPPSTDLSQNQIHAPTATVHWPSTIIGLMLFGWIVGVTVITQSVAWTSAQFLMERATGGLTDPDFVASVVQSLLVTVPLAPIAFFWKQPLYRMTFRTWLLAVLFSSLATVVHIPGAVAAYASVFLQIIVAGAFAIVVYILRPKMAIPAAPDDRRNDGLLVALTISPLLLLPWAASGAPGAPLEALLNLIAAILFGLCAALLSRRIGQHAPQWISASVGNRLLGGLVAFGALVPMAGVYGFGGNQILMLISVPIVSLIASSILGEQKNVLTLTILFGLGAAGPLLFVDPREMTLALSFGLFSTLAVAFRAAALTFFLVAVAGAGLLVWRRLGRDSARHNSGMGANRLWSTLLLAIPPWLILALVFIFMGHPAFHGDRLFVILQDQADVRGAQDLTESPERRRFVYETLVAHAQNTQEEVRADLARFGFEFTPYYLVNGLEVEGGPLLRLWLQNHPDVDRVLYSPVLRPAPSEGAGEGSESAPAGPPWNVEMIGADAVWQTFGATGTGVVIGQSDSGVQWDHPELLPTYRGAADNHDYNWLDPWNGTRQPTDTGGHGTHTLGTVVGQTVGVAPGATWFACANLARNVGSAAYYLDCMQFMLAPYPLDGDAFQDGDPSRGADVLNNSWGCPDLEGCDPGALLPAVTALRHAGLFVVVSAGNDGPTCSTINSPPALYDQVLSVGAIDRFGAITTFSSRGPVTADGSGRTKPDLVAPGLEILSAFPGNGYRSWQGTSMAGPHVAGVVALMWSANPQLKGDVERTEGILLETAQPLDVASSDCGGSSALPNNVVGFGLVDAYAAVNAAVATRAQ